MPASRHPMQADPEAPRSSDLSTDCLWRPWTPNQPEARLTLVSGDGVHVVDSDGRRYLDAQAAYSGAVCGYGVRAIADAIARQAASIQSYPLEQADTQPARELARRIAAVMPGALQHVFFACSGSDAVEAAVKMARMTQRLRGFPTRTTVLTLPAGYHGATLATLAASDIPAASDGFGPLPAGFERLEGSDGGALERALGRLGPEQVAALLVEPVRGVGGVRPLGSTDLGDLAALCGRFGILLIVDEIMTGYGRTGRWCACEHWGIVPDIVTLEKGLTGGYVPLAAAVASPTIYAAFADDPLLGGFRHGHTFSGHPLACAAGVATLDEIQRDGLIENAARVGMLCLAAAERLRARRVVTDVRGLGLLLGVELCDGRAAAQVCAAARDAGVLVRRQGAVLTAAPPLCIRAEQALEIVDVLDAGCARLD